MNAIIIKNLCFISKFIKTNKDNQYHLIFKAIYNIYYKNFNITVGSTYYISNYILCNNYNELFYHKKLKGGKDYITYMPLDAIYKYANMALFRYWFYQTDCAYPNDSIINDIYNINQLVELLNKKTKLKDSISKIKFIINLYKIETINHNDKLELIYQGNHWFIAS